LKSGLGDREQYTVVFVLSAISLFTPWPRLSDHVKAVRDRALMRSGVSPSVSEALSRLSVLAVDLDGLSASAPFSEVVTLSSQTVFRYVYDNGTFSVDDMPITSAEYRALAALLRPGDCVFSDGLELPERYVDDRTGEEGRITPRVAEILAWQTGEWSAKFRVATVRSKSGALLGLAAYPRALTPDEYCMIGQISQIGAKVVLWSQSAPILRASLEGLKNYGQLLSGPEWIQIAPPGKPPRFAGFEKVDDVIGYQKGKGLIGAFSPNEMSFPNAALRFTPGKGEIQTLGGICDGLSVSVKFQRRYRRIANAILALSVVCVAGAFAGTWLAVSPFTIASAALVVDSLGTLVAWGCARKRD
jgi:hypothetical protein